MIDGLRRLLGRGPTTTTVILGMHKSGTSVVAAIVRILGVHMGDKLLGPDASNPLGHYEDVEILDLNERILAASGGSWFRPPARDAILGNRQVFRGEILQLVKKRQAEHPNWGWKDPRSVLTLDLFLPMLLSPRLIVVRRDREDVVASLQRRDGTEPAVGRELFEEYDSRLADILSGTNCPRLEIRFHELLADPTSQITRLARFFDKALDEPTLTKCTGVVMDQQSLQSLRARFEQADRGD